MNSKKFQVFLLRFAPQFLPICFTVIIKLNLIGYSGFHSNDFIEPFDLLFSFQNVFMMF